MLPGFGTGGACRKLCARESCRNIAQRRSSYCRLHDLAARRKRREQLRTGKGRPATAAESARLYRANVKRLWSRSPWQPLQTIWLALALESGCIEDYRRGCFNPAEIAPVVLNNLRWAWRRSVLDRGDHPGWERALIAARRRQLKIGPAPADYRYQPPSPTPPTDVRIKRVHRHATGSELAAQTSPVDRDRTSKAKQRRKLARARSNERKPPRAFDAVAFLSRHWRDKLEPIFTRHRLDPDSPIATRIAVAYNALLEEQQRDAAAGPAFKRWVDLLHELAL